MPQISFDAPRCAVCALECGRVMMNTEQDGQPSDHGQPASIDMSVELRFSIGDLFVFGMLLEAFCGCVCVGAVLVYCTQESSICLKQNSTRGQGRVFHLW